MFLLASSLVRCLSAGPLHGSHLLHSPLFSALLLVSPYETTTKSSNIPALGLPLLRFPSILPSITSCCCCLSPWLRPPLDRSPRTASGCRQGVFPLLQQLRHCHGFVPEIQGFQMGFDVNAREEVLGVVYVCLAERAKRWRMILRVCFIKVRVQEWWFIITKLSKSLFRTCIVTVGLLSVFENA